MQRKESKRPKLILRQKQSTKLVQRYIVAGGVLSLFAFAVSFIYWNFGTNTQTLAAAVNYTWNGTTDSLWTTPTNWTPAGVPSTVDNVTIGTVARNPIITSNQTVNNFIINNNGTININNNTLQINGTASFNGGTILNSGVSGSVISQGNTTTFGTGTTSITINTDLTVNSSTLTCTRCTFNGITNLTKTGTSNDQSGGNNTFNGITTITNSGTGYFLMANSTRDIFNGEVSFNSSGSGIIYPAYNGTGTQFNQNINVSSTSTGGVRFGANSGTSTLALNKTLSIGNAGFSSGMLMLSRFTPTGTSPFSISLTGNAVLSVGPTTTFDSDFTATCPGICLNGATINGTTLITKTGTTNDAGTGNNIFNGTTTITNNGTGYFLMSNSTRDIFNADVNFISTNTGIIYPAYNGTGTQFNQDITVSSTSTGGVRIGANTGTSMLALNKTFSIGNAGFNSGMLMLGRFTPIGANPFTISLTGSALLSMGPSTTFDGDFTSSSPGLSLNGNTFNGTATFTKTGNSNDAGSGNNIFNGLTTLTNTGTGYILLSNSTRDLYNADVNFISTNSGIIYPAYNGTGTQFNQNISVTSTSTGGVRFGANTGTSTLALNKNLTIGNAGFSGGMLLLGNFTPLGTAPFSISLTGSAQLSIGPNTTFGGDVTATASGIILNGVTINGIATLTKTGTSNDAGTGNNTFNGTTTITNGGTGYLILANSTRDIFNGDVYFTSTNTGIIYPAYNGNGTQFNQNIVVSSTSTGGVRIGANTGSSLLALNKTLSIGNAGFSGGMLLLGNFTPAGNSPTSITLTGNAILTVGPSTTFGGDFTATAGGICLNGTTFNGTTTLTKTGTTNDAGTGNNTFNGNTSITNSGTGYILSANSTRDIFNAEVNLNNTSSGIIYMAHNGTGTQFNQNIIVSSIGTGSIRFGANSGTSILANNKTITVGNSGFSAGTLSIGRMTTDGITPISLNLTGTSILTIGPSVTFDSDFSATGGGIILSGSTFNGKANFIKTGTSNDQGAGNNTFNDTTSFTNTGTGYLMLSNVTRDIFNSSVTFSNTNSSYIYPAYNGSGTQFNQNIIVNNTGSGGIRIGYSTGTATLAAGKTLSIGSNGFTSGELNISKFTQVGSTSQAMNITSGTAVLSLSNGTTFNGDVNFNFPQITLSGTTFNGNSIIEKNGGTNNTCFGGNIFNGNATIKNSGVGRITLAFNAADDFNGDATFIQTGLGDLFAASNTNSTFAKNISTIGSTKSLIFGNSAGGIVTLNGSSPQNIYGDSLFSPIINRLSINNSSNGLTLNVKLTVNNNLTLTSGIINTTLSNLLVIGSGISTIAGVSDSSFINGPVRKIGNVAFTFPTGKYGHYRPISISSPTTITDHFTAEYFAGDPNDFYNINSHDATINHMSRCEYWSLSRTNGIANVRVTLSWNTTSCGVSSLPDLRVSRWDAGLTKWIDLGNGTTTGDTQTGTITSTSTTGTYGTFTLGSSSAANALPVKLIDFSVEKDGTAALIKWQTASEKNNDYFTVEKSSDGKYFESLEKVKGFGNSIVKQSYQLKDENPYNGTSYYRLKQTDFNGKFETFKAVPFDIINAVDVFKINSAGPNPFSDVLHIRFKSSNETEVTIELINTAGSLVYQDTKRAYIGENDLDVTITADIKPGIYFIKLIKDNQIAAPVKVVKNK